MFFPFDGKVIAKNGKYIVFEHSKVRYSLDGIINEKVPEKKAEKAKLELTNENLILKPKNKKLSPIEIPIDEIESFDRIKIYIKPTKFKENQMEIVRNDGRIYYILFGNVNVNMGGGVSAYTDRTTDFYWALQNLINYPKARDESEKRKELFEKLEKFFIEIPSKIKISELTSLKCPSCQAPLQYLPPCECEHCEVLIDFKRNII